MGKRFQVIKEFDSLAEARDAGELTSFLNKIGKINMAEFAGYPPCTLQIRSCDFELTNGKPRYITIIEEIYLPDLRGNQRYMDFNTFLDPNALEPIE